MSLPEIGTIGVTPTFGNNFDRFVAKGIQYFTATRDQYGKYNMAKVNHAVVYVGDINTKAKPQLVQAQPGGADFADWDSYGDSMIWLDKVDQKTETGFVPLTPTDEQRAKIREFAIDCAVKKIGYNYLDFVAIAMAQRRFQVWGGEQVWLEDEWWVKRLSRGNKLICSQLDDAAWHSAGLDLFADKRPPGLVSPADLLELQSV